MEQVTYDRLWEDAAQKISAGNEVLDHNLLDRLSDKRRGITLMLRPGAEVRARCAEIIAQMQASEPDQYYYHPNEYHVTVLTLITAIEDFDLAQTPISDYNRILGSICAATSPFRICFRGITASAGAIIAQGFVEHDALNQLRDKLRAVLSEAGYGAYLDTRYKIDTAHATIARFKSPLRDSQRFVSLLESLRTQDLGESIFTEAEFVFNDWYMARDTVQTLATFEFSPE